MIESVYKIITGNMLATERWHTTKFESYLLGVAETRMSHWKRREMSRLMGVESWKSSWNSGNWF